ncbi:LysR substrate-binding domain-containing protein [Pseudomonas sp. 1121_17]|uniref:LysR substrate-binding domain-containing protein n=1 Tax=Pseudomonas sp. 1121_17 TaxID=2604458 RepID=UPI0040647208
MRSFPLPPLNSLIAFESAARNLSFTQASVELSVTQGAVSKQIKLLEDYLGKELLLRSTKKMELTPAGVDYYEVVRKSLCLLADGTDRIRGVHGSQELTVAATTAMASLWLMPKVSTFQASNEEIELRIVASDSPSQLAQFDIILNYLRHPPRGCKATALFDEEIFPVCSPEYLLKNPRLATPEGLSDCTWLYLEDMQKDWLGWSEWFEGLEIAAPTPKRKLKINSYSMLLQSCLDGQGVALGWSYLVDDYLRSGSLIKPMTNVLKTGSKFWLIESDSYSRNQKGVDKFRNWLIDQMPFM